VVCVHFSKDMKTLSAQPLSVGTMSASIKEVCVSQLVQLRVALVSIYIRYSLL
jgi:hypothetical protein